jgi:hypothetical protein
MKTNINRPDTPLANTPEPQPVSSGFQSPSQMGGMPQQRPTTKFEQTANNAIQQVSKLSQESAMAMQPAQPAQPQEANQPQQQQ